MSGLCVIVARRGDGVPATHLERMIDAARHRGPDGTARLLVDGEGRSASGGVGHAAFAHQALATTPESLYEQQPLRHAPSGVVLVADARIDDRDALGPAWRAFLATSARSASRTLGEATDAELILAAFLHEDLASGRSLIGDYAFVVYDAAARRLVAIRDAMGLRPLYVREEPGRVLVASEVSQILAAPGVPAVPDAAAVAAHLRGDFRDAAGTAYEGISAVPPGHAFVMEGDRTRIERVWEIDPAARVRYRRDEEYAEHLRETFASAVQARLRSFAPIGIQLSGGLDSGAAAATAGHLIEGGQASPPALRSYSWAFERFAEADERAVSDILVDRFGLEATAVPGDDLWPLCGRTPLGPDVDDPFAGPFQALLERANTLASRDGVRVVMAGARGDLVIGDAVQDAPGLLLAGRWRALRADLELYRRWKGRSQVAAVREMLLRPLATTVSTHPLVAPARRAVRRAVPRRPRRRPGPAWLPTAPPTLGDRRAPSVVPLDPPSALIGAARRARYAVLFSGMQLRSLAWEDRMTARAGLELVDPWSDRRVAELVMAIPPWVVQSIAEPKGLARAAMRGIMPERARTAARKVSPERLYDYALADGARTFVDDLLVDMRAAELGYVDAAALRRHHGEIVAGGPSLPEFWWALTLEMWLRRHIAP